MILIDALYINDGGGKVLLEYLIEELKNSEKEVFYLLDQRMEQNDLHLEIGNQVLFETASLSRRKKFYIKNKSKFSTIFCFGNLPPNVRIDSKVYTYFHQLLFLKVPREMPFHKKGIYYLKTQILNHYKRNTDFWLVQTNLVKESLSNKYFIKTERIMTLPFFPPLPKRDENFVRIENQYLYVSNAPQHKNHLRLIEAFCCFYDEYQTGNLVLTVSDNFPIIKQLIKEKQIQNYPIQNIGFVNRCQLQKHYQQSRYVVYPSLTESFGLGLVEAIENGCKIIAADLPYTYAVCEPSMVFDPHNEKSIKRALISSIQSELKPSISKVRNEIKAIISLLN